MPLVYIYAEVTLSVRFEPFLRTVNMVPRGMIAVAPVLLCFILGLLGPASAALGSHRGKSCCTTYSRKLVPFQHIRGYREQSITEYCRIEAIIFYTIKKTEICATRRDAWVRNNLKLLSSRLKKMSASAKRPTKNKAAVPPTNEGRGFSTTQSFFNGTDY
ncbi:C-C motif chemokine 20-like [Betta splendens]|uniref:C-C motif chemokine 20-like n=1 Tax=Betta splendens TaxID=158456 RepID=A0A6P7L3M8_BETSP|nr:C-C motif chemokine 20-like [Betta splendens]